jgi:hypothetical protein
VPRRRGFNLQADLQRLEAEIRKHHNVRLVIIAYQSQFNDPTNRAHGGQAKIKSRLIASLDPDEWDLPPKPKWMRWATYNRHVAGYDHYDAILDRGFVALAAKLFGK